MREEAEGLVALKQDKIDAIRSRERKDWSKQVLEKTVAGYLDKTAINSAREKVYRKTNQEHISTDAVAISDEQFLTKIDGSMAADGIGEPDNCCFFY